MNLESFFEKTKVIALLQEKGGAGRTTMATNLARGLQLRGLNVLLADTDPQGSARDWNEENQGALLPVIGLDRTSLAADIIAVKKGYHIIIIDGAPNLAKLSAAAIRAADIVLIPVQPSPYDVWATAGLVELIKDRQTIMNGNPKAAFILSRVIKHTLLSKDIREALENYDLPVFENFVSQSVTYPTTASAGKTVFDIKPTEATQEITRIIDELLRRFICH